jgi:hypothetical protein
LAFFYAVGYAEYLVDCYVGRISILLCCVEPGDARIGMWDKPCCNTHKITNPEKLSLLKQIFLAGVLVNFSQHFPVEDLF